MQHSSVKSKLQQLLPAFFHVLYRVTGQDAFRQPRTILYHFSHEHPGHLSREPAEHIGVQIPAGNQPGHNMFLQHLSGILHKAP